MVASSALALQPLEVFLKGARQVNVDNREAALAAVQQEAEALVTLGHELPAFNARGVLTYNQYEAGITLSLMAGAPPQKFIIQPQVQLDGFLELDAPIIDIAGWVRSRAADKNAHAARHNIQATLLDVEKQVASSYYQLIGAEALRQAAERALAVAQANYELTRERRSNGIATKLDIERAAAEVEQAKQDIANAELSSQLARRALLTLTGIVATGDVIAVVDDLHPETPLEFWEN